MNPNPDEFEQRLAACRLRPAPGEVQEDVLRALRQERQRRDAASARSEGPAVSAWSVLAAWVRGISPAWRVLGAAWVVGLTLNALCHTSTPAEFAGAAPLSREQIAAERAVRLEMMVLAGLREPDRQPAEPPRVVPPRPRSSLKVVQRPSFG
jgi:hypothetical protein